MKIGILTFHDVFNPGAFLQALGTQSLLQSMGHEPWIIDYTSPSHRFVPMRYFWKWHLRMLYRFPAWIAMLQKETAFEHARKQWFIRTQRFETRAEIGKVHFDAVLVGADVVWNFKHAYLGRDPVYFGAGVDSDRLISFAASFGDCSLEDGLPDYVASGLGRFHEFSVRDRNTAQIVSSVTGGDPVQICDPAFHLDLSQLVPAAESAAPFMFVYLRPGTFPSSLGDAIIKFARRKQLRVIAAYYTHRWVDQNLVGIQPTEWLRLIRDAAYVVTNTFHGSVFSIMLEKPFALHFNEGIRLKTADMIDSMKLRDRIVEAPASLSSVLEISPDFSSARKWVQIERERARDFLLRALGAATA